MPYRTEKKGNLLPEHLDRRIKLTIEQKIDIKEKYAQGGLSWQDLANEYGVSKRLIGFIVNPATLETNKSVRGHTVYSKDGWAKVMREHRTYKHQVLSKEQSNGIPPQTISKRYGEYRGQTPDRQ